MTTSEGAGRAPSEPEAEDSVRPLPEGLRARVVAVAAEGLGAMPADQLPPALKRVATFAPARRAKLAGSQIAAVLESDAEFRSRLGVQVRALMPEIAAALDAGKPPAAAQPADVAAAAFILRPERWQEIVQDAVKALEAERDNPARGRQVDQVDRLRRQLDTAVEEHRAAQQRTKDEIARLKAENADLRRKLGDTRSQLRAAQEVVDRSSNEALEIRRSQAVALAGAEAEARRLRVRVDELEAEIGAARRDERLQRDTGTLRARLLLDTLLETAQGLRRELALPPAEGAPADVVEAHVAEQGSRAPTGHGSLTSDDPTMLDALIALPRAHMIVDGYNVTKTAWPELPLEKQRDRLLRGLAPLVARSGAEVTVVFDAADKQERPLVNRPRGVRVLFSPVGVIADDVIRELVAAEPPGRPVVVVSSDHEVVRDVLRAGARACASAALPRLLSRS